MSHFTKNKGTFVTSIESFVKACGKLGLKGKLQTGGQIRMYDGTMVPVKAAFVTGQYALGLQEEEEGKYSLCGDIWGVKCDLYGSTSPLKNMGDQDLMNKVLQETTKITIEDTYAEQGFVCETVEDKQTGGIELTLTRNTVQW